MKDKAYIVKIKNEPHINNCRKQFDTLKDAFAYAERQIIFGNTGRRIIKSLVIIEAEICGFNPSYISSITLQTKDDVERLRQILHTQKIKENPWENAVLSLKLMTKQDIDMYNQKANFVIGFFGLKNRSGDPMELSMERHFHRHFK